MHPVLFHSGPVVIPAYGVAMALGLIAALALGLRTARRQGLAPNEIWNLGILSLFCAFVAAKLWLVLTNLPLLKTYPALLLNLSAVSDGAPALIGAAIGILVAIAYALRSKMPLRSVLDAITAPALLLFAFHDMGCWLAGCGWGTPTTSIHFASRFSSDYAFVWWGTPMHRALHPVQLLGAFVFAALTLLALWMGTWGLRSGRLAAWALVLGGTAQFLLEFWRGDVSFWAPLGWLTATQAIALASMALAGFLFWDPPAWRSLPPQPEAQR